ncbi:hypothetical protein QN239_31960 [Mycolicibacterium sp. Y3]
MFGVGSYVKVREGVSGAEGLEGSLCQVVGVQGALRDIRRVDASTEALSGISVRFVASELEQADR